MSDWPSSDEVAKQIVFAKFVGISQPAVSGLISKGVLRNGETYGEWLYSYVSRLRSEAAGREQNERLSAARIRDTEASANLRELDYFEKTNQIIWVEDLRESINEIFASVQSSVLSARDKIIQGVESKHKIKLDDEIISEPLRSALASVASSKAQFESSVGYIDEGVDSAEADVNGGLVSAEHEVAEGER